MLQAQQCLSAVKTLSKTPYIRQLHYRRGAVVRWQFLNRGTKEETYNFLHYGKSTVALSSCCHQEQNYRRKPSAKKALHKEIQCLRSMLIHSRIPPQNILRDILTKDTSRWFSSSPYRRQQGQQQQDPQNPEKQPDDEENKKKEYQLYLLLMALIAINFLIPDDAPKFKDPEDKSTQHGHVPQDIFISWNEFLHGLLAKGEVDEILVDPQLEMALIKLQPGAVFKGRKVRTGFRYMMKLPDVQKFEDKVRKAEGELGIKPGTGVSITYKRSSISPLHFLVFIIMAALLFRLFGNTVNMQIPDMFSQIRKARFVRVDQISNLPGKGVTFRDVAGLHEAKVEVMEFVDYLKNPEKYKTLGARVPRGALLTGPPGCGKTLLAKAVATEAKVPFLAMAGSEFVEVVGGLGAARVRDLFAEARQKAPCIIYLDEIDAIGRTRADGELQGGSGEGEHTLNQLLVEMDGMDTVEGIIMLASTNRQEMLDKALMRPGRFDRHIMIDLPTLAERKEIFEIYLSRLKLVRPVTAYMERLAQLSPGMSGADISNICNEAALAAAREKKKSIDTDDFEYAVERVSEGAAKKSRVLSPQEKRIVAFHEAGHAVTAWLLQNSNVPLSVTIIPRTGSRLGFAKYMPDEKHLISKEELFDRMCMMMGGRAAETIIFNSVTSNSTNDLRQVTEYAYKQIRTLGMNDEIGHLSFDVNEDNKYGMKPYSKRMANLMDDEARKLVAEAYRCTEDLLIKNKHKLRTIAEALLEKETLSYSDMEELIGPPPFPKQTTLSAKWGAAAPEPTSSL